MAVNLTVAYIVLGIYLLLVLGCGVIGAFMNWRNLSTSRKGSLVSNWEGCIGSYELITAALQAGLFLQFCCPDLGLWQAHDKAIQLSRHSACSSWAQG